jgi:hypothetical protein
MQIKPLKPRVEYENYGSLRIYNRGIRKYLKGINFLPIGLAGIGRGGGDVQGAAHGCGGELGCGRVEPRRGCREA